MKITYLIAVNELGARPAWRIPEGGFAQLVLPDDTEKVHKPSVPFYDLTADHIAAQAEELAAKIQPGSVVIYDDTNIPKDALQVQLRKHLLDALGGEFRIFIHFGGSDLSTMDRKSIEERMAEWCGEAHPGKVMPFVGEPRKEQGRDWVPLLYDLKERLRAGEVPCEELRALLDQAWEGANAFFDRELEAAALVKVLFPLYIDATTFLESRGTSAPAAEWAAAFRGYPIQPDELNSRLNKLAIKPLLIDSKGEFPTPNRVKQVYEEFAKFYSQQLLGHAV